MGITRSFSRSAFVNLALSRDLPERAAARPDATPPARSVEDQVSLYFAELSSPVYRYLSYACRHHGDAEEITQEVFLRLYRALDANERIENVRHWTFRVARNLMIDRAKRLKRRAPHECELSNEMCDVIADPLPTPEQSLVSATREAQVRRAVEELTELQQRCVQLRAEGFMLREIAELLDMDVRRVAEAIQRGVKNIQRSLGA
jgi:RNA polymerase sigma-70 factor (ECF subfamily)